MVRVNSLRGMAGILLMIAVLSKGMQHGHMDRGILHTLIHSNPLFNPLKEYIKQSQYAIIHNPDKYNVAYVRQGSALATEEIFWRNRRFAKIKAAQEKFLGMSLADDEVLEIAISCSGGGFRAMLGALGSLKVAEETGLLDCVMSLATLSGSTWLVAPWITSGMSLSAYKDFILPKLSWGLLPDHVHEFTNVIDRFLVKFAYAQPLTLVDLYGGLLANTLFEMCGKESLEVYLSGTIHENAPSQEKRIAHANYPFPIYTAVLGDMDYAQEWFEFTPYEVGCRSFNAYIPSWSFGRTFKQGVSTNDAPEQALAYLLGIFGSAFAFNFEQAYDILIRQFVNIPFLQPLIESIVYSELGKIRLAYAEVCNFMYKMPECVLHKRKTLKLVDAGLEFMNPIFATYRKAPDGEAPDMVIVCDYSESGLGLPELSKAAAYAKRKNLKFSYIPHDELCGKRTITVFKENNLEVPVILYMPRIKDDTLLSSCMYDVRYAYYTQCLSDLDWENEISQGFADTLNLEYTKQQAEVVCALHEFNMLVNIDNIRNEMKERVLTKRFSK
jgi:phospholipase A2